MRKHFNRTVWESERRQALIDGLVSTEKRLEQAFNAKTTAANNRSSLLGTDSGSANPWLTGEETDATLEYTNQDLRRQHDRILDGNVYRTSIQYLSKRDCIKTRRFRTRPWTRCPFSSSRTTT